MVSALRPNEEQSLGYRPEQPNQANLEKNTPDSDRAPDVLAPTEQINIEKNQSSPDGTIDNTIDLLRSKLRRTRRPIQIPPTRDTLTKNVETVMSEGLDDVFRELTPVQQQEFKIKGEQTAQLIRQLLSKTKIKIAEIFKLIFEWLQILPGINKYFLEQEAKIKAEKIIALRHFDNNKK
jgi:hypothetical protein